jgi:3'(2'), 5'-bisphosphate nucleotidase
MKKEWVDIAIKAAEVAGEEILRIYNSNYEIITKADQSPVTAADLASNTIIQEYLRKTGVPVLSEEEDFGSYESRKDLPFLWVVDPLDGTKEFIKKNNDFTVNIALVVENKPVFGLIYIPFRRQAYFAVKGQGAFLLENGVKTKLPIILERDNYVFLKSRSHPDKKLEKYLLALKKEHPNLELKVVGSAVKFCEIAYGNADEYTRFNPTMEWDTAAGQIIMNEVGRHLVDMSTGLEMTYNRENLKNSGFTIK